MKKLINLFVCLLPWKIKRWVLVRFYGYDLHPTAWIGLAYAFPDKLIMGPGARIGPLTVALYLHEIRLEEHAYICRLNWITGHPVKGNRHYRWQRDRQPVLHVKRHASITNRHLIDCSNRVEIGEFTTFAGFRSQILTHSINLERGRQETAPVIIGRYCFIGTGCIILPGAILPDYSVLGAGAVLNRAHTETHMLYAGQPAMPRKALPPDAAYFKRKEGF